MLKNVPSIIILFFILVFPFISYSHYPLITEVLHNPSTYLDRSEWIELYNNTTEPILIDGWKVTDGEVCGRFLQIIIIFIRAEK
jgi:cellobiose-specific phosphotransferase system component IIC